MTTPAERLPPRAAESTLATMRHGQLLDGAEGGLLDSRDHHLGDPHPAGHLEGIGAQVDQQLRF